MFVEDKKTSSCSALFCRFLLRQRNISFKWPFKCLQSRVSEKHPFLDIQYYIDLPCNLPVSENQPIFGEVHTPSYCLLLYIITKVFMPVSIHRSESNIIYKVHSWRKTPLTLPFYTVGFTKLLSEVILHIPTLGQKRKTTSWELASHIFRLLDDCKFVPLWPVNEKQ